LTGGTIHSQWRRKGTKGGMRPGRHCAGGGIWRSENAEFGSSAASGELAFCLHCRTNSAVSLVGYSTQLHSKISVLFTVHNNAIVVPVPIRISIADLIRGGGRRKHRRLPRGGKNPRAATVHSFVTGEPRDFIFGTLTYYSMSHPAEEKSSLKGAWSWSNNPF